MIYSVLADTCVDAWLKASTLLLELPDREAYTVILDIGAPAVLTPENKRVIEVVDAFLTTRGIDPISTVAGTIFPAAHYRRSGVVGVYTEFPERVYPKIKSGWGTYAYRLLRRADATGKVINPLEILVNKIKKQLELPGTLGRAYEANVIDPFLDISLYQASTDANLTLRQPCLSHLSFKVIQRRTVMLTALYRSHYYLQRALGNLLGLSQLLLFVANETGLTAGELVCHSSYACLETNAKWKLAEVRALIGSCRQTSTLSQQSGQSANASVE